MFDDDDEKAIPKTASGGRGQKGIADTQRVDFCCIYIEMWIFAVQ